MTHPFYKAWCNMRQRCNNPEHPGAENYSVRGIGYCLAWESFKEFHRDMWPTWQEGLTLERNNNEGDYCKENCRWATRTEQNRNQRSTKATPEIAAAIRELAATTQLTQGQIGKRFKLNHSVVQNILSGRQWAVK